MASAEWVPRFAVGCTDYWTVGRPGSAEELAQACHDSLLNVLGAGQDLSEDRENGLEVDGGQILESYLSDSYQVQSSF